MTQLCMYAIMFRNNRDLEACGIAWMVGLCFGHAEPPECHSGVHVDTNLLNRNDAHT